MPTMGSGRVQFQSLFDVVGTAYVTTNPASVAIGATDVATTVTIPGAALGDYVLVSLGISHAGMIVQGYVSAANTVVIALSNNTAGAIDLGALNADVIVLRANPNLVGP